jgi:hypothetical protein
MVRLFLRSFLHAIAGVALMASATFAQDTIAVSGLVRDVSGAVIAEASVEAVVADRVAVATTTGADGRYSLTVPSGTPFALRAHRTGFADQSVAFAGSSRAITRDIDMAIGTVSDTLVVSAARGFVDRAAVTQAVNVM